MTVLGVVIDRLQCPVCRGSLALDGVAVECPAGHRFDVAKQGYVTLLGGRRRFPGDDAAMVAAREAFLGRGHYAPLSAALALALRDVDGLVVDLAGGTGHHLAQVLDSNPALVGLVLDASTPALKRAARAHGRLAAVGADVMAELPLCDGAAAAILSVFGPRNVPEIQRVLAPGGRLVVATPTPRHLQELVERFAGLGMVRVDPGKDARLAASLGGFELTGERVVEHRATMSRQDVRDEVFMGPSAHHVDPGALAVALEDWSEPGEVTVSVTVRSYRSLISPAAVGLKPQER